MNIIKSISLMLVLAFTISIAKAQQPANNIGVITADYLGVKNALVANDGKTASVKAKELFAALSDQPAKGLNPNQQKFLNTYLDKLKFDSRHISEVSIVEHQREHFASLSKNMYEVLKGLKVNTITIYEQYCPMKKAYWLSETASIKNPYYNDKMMATCGNTKATLAAIK